MSKLTFAILLLLASAALVVFGVLPAWNDVSATRTEISGLISLNDELQTIAKARDDLTAQYNAISQSDAARLSGVLPTGPASSQFLKDMEALATTHSMFLKSIDFSKQVTAATTQIQLAAQKSYVPVSLSFNTRGTYESLHGFLSDLEKMVRITDITDISFTAQASGVSQAPAYDYALKGFIYYAR